MQFHIGIVREWVNHKIPKEPTRENDGSESTRQEGLPGMRQREIPVPRPEEVPARTGDGGRDHGDEVPLHGVRICVEGAGQVRKISLKAWGDGGENVGHSGDISTTSQR